MALINRRNYGIRAMLPRAYDIPATAWQRHRMEFNLRRICAGATSRLIFPVHFAFPGASRFSSAAAARLAHRASDLFKAPPLHPSRRNEAARHRRFRLGVFMCEQVCVLAHACVLAYAEHTGETLPM